VDVDTARRVDSGTIVTVLTVAVGLQCLRVLFPIAYSYREGHGLLRTVVVVGVVFLTPVGAILAGRGAAHRTVLLACVIALAVGRLVLQLVGSIGIGLAAMVAAVALAAVVLAVDARSSGAAAAVAVVGGLALDTALRVVWGTWDLAWQHGWLPTCVSVLLLAALAASVLALPHRTEGSWGSAFDVLAVGPYLALQVLLLQNVAAVAATAAVALATATVIVFVADGLAAVAVLATTRRAPPRVLVAVMTIALGLIAWGLTGARGIGFVVLFIVGQAVATFLLSRASASSMAHQSLAALIGAVFASMGVLGATLFLYQLHYDKPLPVSNRWLPVLAAVVLGVAALLAPADDAVSAPSRLRRTRVYACAALIAAIAIAVVVGVEAGEPDFAAQSSTSHGLTVMTFNVHNAVDRDGQLDPGRVADAVQRVDPDVVVVEEAGRGWPLSSTIDLAEWMKRRLDMPYRWAPAADHTMGNLVFSRVPIHEARIVRLPRGTGTMTRSALVARVGPVDGRDVTVVGTHLQNGSSPDRKDTRVVELDALLEALGPSRVGTIIAGDLNSDPSSRELRHLLDASFTTTQPAQRCTLKTSNDNCVDWILVTGDLSQGRPRVIAVPEFDHNPVVSTVRVP
jgi:endonuclease/exonuclease/phosphatase family metal-dependent hydrolase